MLIKNFAMRLSSGLFLLKWWLHDFIRYRSSLVPWVFRAFYLFTGRRKIKFLLAFHRATYNNWAMEEIKRNLESITSWSLESCSIADKDKERALFLKRSIIIKEPEFSPSGDVRRRGVIIITFSTTFPFVLRSGFLDQMLKDYIVVLEPSWSGYALPEILAWANFDTKVVVQATEPRDFEFLNFLNSNLLPVDFGASDWVDHEVFFPRVDSEKIYDSLLVGNCSYVKRIYVYLAAIKGIQDNSYRGALVLGEWGAFANKIKALVHYYGVEKNVEVFGNVTPAKLNELYNCSKSNVLLSLKEGSNRVIFEGMFANTPAIVLSNNVGVNKNYINSKTGLLISERELGCSLVYMKENWKQFSPRKWAMDNISCHRTTKKLISFIGEEIDPNFQNLPKSQVSIKVNRPEVDFLDSREKKIQFDALLSRLVGSE